MKSNALSAELRQNIDAYWRADNYLSVGQIYLCDNPLLLRRPLALSDVKPMLLGHWGTGALGHWGTTPGQNFIYAHLNRIKHDRLFPARNSPQPLGRGTLYREKSCLVVKVWSREGCESG